MPPFKTKDETQALRFKLGQRLIKQGMIQLDNLNLASIIEIINNNNSGKNHQRMLKLVDKNLRINKIFTQSQRLPHKMLITYKGENINYESGEVSRTPPRPSDQSSHQQQWHKEGHGVTFLDSFHFSSLPILPLTHSHL